MDSNLPLVSFVCYHGKGEDSLARFHGELCRVMRPLELGYCFEILYVADPTQVATLARINALTQLDPRVRLVTTAPGARGDDPAQVGLRRATGEFVIVLDVELTTPDLAAKLLEVSKGLAEIVVAYRKPSQTESPKREIVGVLLKRPAADAVMAAHDGRHSLPELALASGLSCVELPLAAPAAPPAAAKPMPVVPAKPQVTPASRPMTPLTTPLTTPVTKKEEEMLESDARETDVPETDVTETDTPETDEAPRFRLMDDPFPIITRFGIVVLAIGVFLTIWFPVQHLLAPGSVWFSWCYLIVLLHILGGVSLFGLGKVGTLALRILEQEPPSLVHMPTPQDLARQDHASATQRQAA